MIKSFDLPEPQKATLLEFDLSAVRPIMAKTYHGEGEPQGGGQRLFLTKR